MKHESLFSLKGQFLIAMPGLADPNFAYTVICMCEHTYQGGIGLVINRVYPSISAQDIFSELHIEYNPYSKPIPVHYGGPVHTNEIFVLHGPPFDWDACAMISPTLAMSNTRDILEAIADNKGPESFLIILGCSGWGQNQVEAEIKQNAWLSCPVSEDIIFDVNIEKKWDQAVKKMGINPLLLSGEAGHA
ncbi:DUF0301 [Desulfonema limicola]|uniref:UPF0301 protein dnl_19870 n=1 Tax=Desulfonema limicola TaxID=45656 RepID=A0A975B6I0_9BACT|nr:YqgE/AlgH family protein [Desulfonema limicola]QTA79711.1 DUF0301 [Desulfonema limicola]